jgi:hypothetical protein
MIPSRSALFPHFLALLVLTACALPGRAADAPVKAAIIYNAADCTFSIKLRNASTQPVAYYDSFGAHEAGVARVPWFTRIYIKDGKGRILSGIGGDKDEGYTVLIQTSSATRLPVAMILLKPGETVGNTFQLHDLALGLYSSTQAKKKDATGYFFKLKTTIYLDENLHTHIDAETDWFPLPRKLWSD